MRRVLRNRIFWLGVALKWALLVVPGSHYLNNLFIPFLDAAIQNITSNPWSLSPPENFPYGSVLYLILALPRRVAFDIFGHAGLGTGPLGVLMVKAPLFGVDLVMLAALLRLAPEHPSRVLRAYWLNPIAFYITYVHGQLDLVVATFLAFDGLS